MQTTAPSIVQRLVSRKELFGIAASLFGLGKALRTFLQDRSLISRRDKLLSRIQPLSAVAHVPNDQAMLAPQEAALAGDAIKVELSKAIAELTSIIKRLHAECVKRGDLSLYQRTFLLYKPANWRGWIAHILCWFFALDTLLYVLGQARLTITTNFLSLSSRMRGHNRYTIGRLRWTFLASWFFSDRQALGSF